MRSDMHSRSSIQWILCLAATVLAPSLAQAHVGVGQTTGFSHGFVHPITGLDHIAAMVAVGLWAAQQGGRAMWVVPLTFVTVMSVGGLLGTLAVSIPFVEPGIAASVLVLGLLTAAAIRLPLVASSLLVGLFAVFHGHAHGTEMPTSASGLVYGIGFILATALLHGCGLGVGLSAHKMERPRVLRYAGGAIAVLGIYLFAV